MTAPQNNPVFIAIGNSMRPLIRPGDRVKLRAIQRADIHCGDIVVFTSAEGIRVIHRVIRTVPLQTRGDNCDRDDLPVPETSPLQIAYEFCRNGKKIALTSGVRGRREFQRHQLRRKLLRTLRKMLAPVIRCNPFRIPFQSLTKSVFADKTVYYAGSRPVAWQDKTGWHWMRFASFFVEAPPEENHE